MDKYSCKENSADVMLWLHIIVIKMMLKRGREIACRIKKCYFKMFTMHIFIGQTLWRRKSSCQYFILGYFWAFLIAGKRNLTYFTFVFGCNNGSSFSPWTFSQFVIYYSLLFLWWTSWLQKWQCLEAFQPRLLLLVLFMRSWAQFFSVLPDWLFCFQRLGLRIFCSALQNLVLM